MSDRARVLATVKLEAPRARVIEYRFAPGAETGWHRHEHDYVVVPMLDGNLLLEEGGVYANLWAAFIGDTEYAA